MPLPPNHLLLHYNPEWCNVYGASIHRLSWKKGWVYVRMYLQYIVHILLMRTTKTPDIWACLSIKWFPATNSSVKPFTLSMQDWLHSPLAVFFLTCTAAFLVWFQWIVKLRTLHETGRVLKPYLPVGQGQASTNCDPPLLHQCTRISDCVNTGWSKKDLGHWPIWVKKRCQISHKIVWKHVYGVTRSLTVCVCESLNLNLIHKFTDESVSRWKELWQAASIWQSYVHLIVAPSLTRSFIHHPELSDSWIVDWVKVSRPTRHNIGHFRDVLPSQSFGIVLKKLNLTQQKQTTEEQNSLN